MGDRIASAIIRGNQSNSIRSRSSIDMRLRIEIRDHDVSRSIPEIPGVGTVLATLIVITRSGSIHERNG